MRRAAQIVVLATTVVLLLPRASVAGGGDGSGPGTGGTPGGDSTTIEVRVSDGSSGGEDPYRPVQVTEEQRRRWREREERRRTGLEAYGVCILDGRTRPECLAIFDKPGTPRQPGEVDATLALVREAFSQLTVTHPGIQMSPPVGNPAWVQLPVWLWVPQESWAERTVEAVSADGLLAVQLTAYPIATRWDMGDGTEVVCDGPGKPYDYSLDEEAQSSECSHVYEKTSARQPNEAYTVTGSMQWGASWESSNALTGTVAPFAVVDQAQVRVGQIQALTGRQGT